VTTHSEFAEFIMQVINIGYIKNSPNSLNKAA